MVGIISINKYSVHMNYGAALHSFAFQKVLDKQGIDNVIIDYYPKFMEGYNLKYPLLNARNLRNLVRWTWDLKANAEKYHKFQHFFSKYCRFTKEKYTKDTLNDISLNNLGIDTFVCESDGIWKPATTRGVDCGYFLHFSAAEQARKLAYAASVGLNMTDNEKLLASEYLKSFDSISVREQDSVKFIQDLVDNRLNVHWVIDPTVLLHRADYQSLLIPPQEKNYLLVYNCTRNNRDMLRIAEKTAKKMGLEVIEISAFRLNNLIFNHKIKTKAYY